MRSCCCCYQYWIELKIQKYPSQSFESIYRVSHRYDDNFQLNFTIFKTHISKSKSCFEHIVKKSFRWHLENQQNYIESIFKLNIKNISQIAKKITPKFDFILISRCQDFFTEGFRNRSQFLEYQILRLAKLNQKLPTYLWDTL